MTTFLLVVHALIALALVTVILLQRSEGGGLGIGGGTGGGMVSVRGAANLLTRATTFLAVLFISTSILLAVLAAGTSKPKEVDTSLVPVVGAPVAPADAAPAQGAPSDAVPAETLPTLPGLGDEGGVPLAR